MRAVQFSAGVQALLRRARRAWPHNRMMDPADEGVMIDGGMHPVPVAVQFGELGALG